MLSTIWASLIANAVPAILGWLAGVLTKLIHGWIQEYQTKKESQDSVQPLKDAKTGANIDKASDSALSGF